jgi:hypothetical protein
VHNCDVCATHPSNPPTDPGADPRSEPLDPSCRSPKHEVCLPVSTGLSRMEVVMSRQIFRVRWIATAIGIALTAAACKSGGGY